MLLDKLLKNVSVSTINGDTDIEIEHVFSDSREVIKNSMFVCIKGYKVDGHEYVDNAIKSGAICIVAEKNIPVPNNVALVIVPDSRIAMAIIANNFFGYPSKEFKLIGVTGTNGKTTTTFLIKTILEHVGQKVGLIGTIENMIGSKAVEAHRTTPDIVELQKLFRDMSDENVDAVIMEVSSHALELHRVDGSDFDIGIFTNLTQDHLDFHETLENYLNAKIKLFKMSKFAVVNADDKSSEKVIQNLNNDYVTYGISDNCSLVAKDIDISARGTSYTLVYNSNEYLVKVAIPGEFTVYNSLAAIGACLRLDIDIKDIIKGLKISKGVPGRSEVIPTDTEFTVILDYAHTPDGLENIIKSVNRFTKGRLITVFGCGGDRDKTKRPIMGKIAGDLSDICIVTSDNPRTEDPSQIIEQIVDGIKNTKCEYEVIENRREAIEYALNIAKKNDVVLLAGKGHETYQILRDKTIHFDEKEIVYEILSHLSN